MYVYICMHTSTAMPAHAFIHTYLHTYITEIHTYIQHKMPCQGICNGSHVHAYTRTYIDI